MAKKFFVFILFFGFASVLLAQKIFLPNQETKLHIKKVKIAGQEQELAESFKSEYSHNNIEIFYDLFPANEAATYKYRLVSIHGFENDFSNWKYSHQNEISILGLPAGEYDFELIAILPSGAEVAAIEKFHLNISKPWWREKWFWAICFLSMFGLFYGRERILRTWKDGEEKQHKRIAELELRTLQLQMNPHFIFNALNSIQSFIISNDTLTANNYLSKFANLIRMFLDSSRSKYIAISEEINLLKLYAEIEGLRFDGKFNFEVKVDATVNRFIEIPTMILQPFVENAINHGLRYKKDTGILKIHFSNKGENLVCRIIDDGVGREKAKKIQTKSWKGYVSQGLKITAERLDSFNKINETNIQFSIENLNKKIPGKDIDLGTVVEVKFPKIIE